MNHEPIDVEGLRTTALRLIAHSRDVRLTSLRARQLLAEEDSIASALSRAIREPEPISIRMLVPPVHVGRRLLEPSSRRQVLTDILLFFGGCVLPVIAVVALLWVWLRS